MYILLFLLLFAFYDFFSVFYHCLFRLLLMGPFHFELKLVGPEFVGQAQFYRNTRNSKIYRNR